MTVFLVVGVSTVTASGRRDCRCLGVLKKALRSPVTLTFSSAASVRDFLIGVSGLGASSAPRFLGGHENDDDDDDDDAEDGLGAVKALRMA